ncbi:MAG TPA: hypothetical protein GX697_01580 [Firmicutes bacterium]|nr:hypothetical protein [Bacillota bacterium]
MVQLILFFILALLSVRQRLANKKKRLLGKGEVPLEPVPSPFSTALSELVGSAGGIYLSLVLLVSFLKIEIPPEIFIWEVALEPLALVALITAIIQPYIARLFIKSR